MTSVSHKVDVKYDDLFDYSKIQPVILLDDDDDDDQFLSTPPPKPNPPQDPLTITDSEVWKKTGTEGAEAVKIVDDDDWLEAPPSKPGCHRVHPADPFLLKLRQQKQELVNILQASAKNIEEASGLQARAREAATPQLLLSDKPDRSQQPPNNRQKISLQLQGQSGEINRVRVFVDDKLEKLFLHYASSVGKRPLTDYVFSFDGQQVDPKRSPKDLELEDEDIIEVHVKKARK